MNVGFAIYFIIPFPLSLIVSLGITLLMIVLLTAYINFIKKFKLDKNNYNNNVSVIRAIANSYISTLYDEHKTVFEYNTLKFYYMNFGKEHRKKHVQNVVQCQ